MASSSSSSRTPSSSAQPPSSPPSAFRLPRLEHLDEETAASELGLQRLVKKKKSWFRSAPPASAAQSGSSSIPSVPARSAEGGAVATSAAATADRSDEDVPWSEEAATHAPPHHRSHASNGIRIGIRHRGKLLIRNPEPAPEKPKVAKPRHQSRRERRGREGSVAVEMGVSEFDSARTEGVWRSESGVRARVGRVGDRVRRGVGSHGEDGASAVGGEGDSLRPVSTRASSTSAASTTASHHHHHHSNSLRGLSGLWPHRSGSRTEDAQEEAESAGMPTPPASKLFSSAYTPAAPPRRTSDSAEGGSLTHAEGEDPSLPPSSAPVGMGGGLAKAPQLERLDSGEQLLTTTTMGLVRPATPQSPGNEQAGLPSPPQTPAKEKKPALRADTSTFVPEGGGGEFLSPLPQTGTDPSEPLPWGREAEAAAAVSARSHSPSSSTRTTPTDSGTATPTPLPAPPGANPGEQVAEVVNWTDFRAELAQQEEEATEGGEEFVDERRGRQKLGKGEVVWERLWENQRGILWFGTPRFSSSSLLPTDPSAFTRPGKTKEACRTPYNLDSYQLPDGTWSWASPWMINMRMDGEVDEKGWEYNAFFRSSPAGWHAVLPWHGWKGWVRRREWIRLRIHPPPPKLSSLSPPPSPTPAGPQPLPVTDAGAASSLPPRKTKRTGGKGASASELEGCVRELASQMLDRERLALWSTWLEGEPKAGGSLQGMVESDLPTLLNTFTHPSSRTTLLDVLHSTRPEWKLATASEEPTVVDPRDEKEGEKGVGGRRDGYVIPAGEGKGVAV